MITGSIVALVTPMHADGSVDWAGLERLLDLLELDFASSSSSLSAFSPAGGGVFGPSPAAGAPGGVCGPFLCGLSGGGGALRCEMGVPDLERERDLDERLWRCPDGERLSRARFRSLASMILLNASKGSSTYCSGLGSWR